MKRQIVMAAVLATGLSFVGCGGEGTPENGVTCGQGTALRDGACVSDATVTCGEGTELLGSRCVGSAAPVTCAAGTAFVEGTCRVDLAAVCGLGTQSSAANTCVAQTNSGLSCGEGTTENNGRCEVNGASLCGTGTVWEAGQCTAPAGASFCGPGTKWIGTQCVVGAGDPTVTDFVNKLDLKLGYARTSQNGPYYRHKAMVTDLPASTATDWVELGTSPVGSGSGLHVVAYGKALVSEVAIRIQNSTNEAGTGCSARPLDPSIMGAPEIATVAFVSWNGGQGTFKACAKSGTVRLSKGCDNCRVQMRVNAVMSDGTVIEDKLFTQ